jgi:hypothetical protein
MSDLASVRDNKESIERHDDLTSRAAIGLILSDYAMMAFVFMSGPYARLACPLDGFSMSGTL